MTKHKKPPHDHDGVPADENASANGTNGTDGAAASWIDEAPPEAAATAAMELAQCRGELALAEDRYLRLRAEFDNYRRRTQQDLFRGRELAQDRILLAVLPALDDLERLRQTASGDTDPDGLRRGLELVLAKFASQLEQVGVKAFASRGEPFDPERHDALSVVNDETVEDGRIVEEHVRGYLRGDAVIRHAQVIVNKR